MIRERAPAKVNLLLHVGPPRPDGLHEICSLFASIDLADEVEVGLAGGAQDRVVCPGVAGPNLAQAAIESLRAVAPEALPPIEVRIDKRIPVAAGLGGGSADAAAVLRAANALAGGPLDRAALRAIGATLGADVPSQVEPGPAVVTGAGEGVEPVELPEMALVLVPQAEGLSTAEVYAEADRIPSTRARLDPAAVRSLAEAGLEELAARIDNDLEPAALSLRPALWEVLADLRARGALAARVTGSGPTAFGVFPGRAAAQRAAAGLPAAIVAVLDPAPMGPVRPAM